MVEKEQEWMKGTWGGEIFYEYAEWMNGCWNGDFFYELTKLGDVACLKFCMDNGLISKKYECPVCGEDMKLVGRDDMSDKKVWICRRSGANTHYIKRSLRKGTWFQDSNMGLGRILRLVYMWLNKMPNDSIMNDLGVASQTVSDWKNFCREVCMVYCLSFDGQIGGTGKTVDIYDCWLSEHKYKKKRHIEGHCVFAGLVRNMNDCFFEVVEERNVEKLAEIIQKRVRPGSTVVINSGPMYSSSHAVFQHLVASLNITFKDAEVKSSDATWTIVTRALKGANLDDGEFNGETAEYIWRRQNNLPITMKVQKFLKAVSEAFPPKSKD